MRLITRRGNAIFLHNSQFLLRIRTFITLCICGYILLVIYSFIKHPATNKVVSSKTVNDDSETTTWQPVIFKESKLAHWLLDGLKGIEVGASAHNPFGLDTINVDFTNGTSIFKEDEIKRAGKSVKVDALTYGDCLCLLPFPDESQDFVISSHVIEHFYDPIKTIKEWLRVVKPGGYVYIIAPHKERTFDINQTRTTLNELIERNKQPRPITWQTHFTFWITDDLIELCNHFNWTIAATQDFDDKVGNGFTVVIRKDLKRKLKEKALIVQNISPKFKYSFKSSADNKS
ncbi:methyltransferase domain-containing protein [Ditylenchus destructor]|uniref:Methyltransferase domain-containing protein n=1 Tax=Ditylenchus destructor TaxID=166010 RepID=A0AAD4MZ33_9BILA|nr:methyltransferase domain-containing protein [Ditylenchus destructor]